MLQTDQPHRSFGNHSGTVETNPDRTEQTAAGPEAVGVRSPGA
jgi:hypothetical protein